MLQPRTKEFIRSASVLLRDGWDLVRQRFGRPLPPLARSDIVWAYRTLLDRDPTSEAEVEARLKECTSHEQLRWRIMSSAEYQTRNPPLRMPVLDGDEPPMCIEDLHARQELQTLLAHVQTAWQHLGETEPYWSVVTGAEYLMANIDQSRDQFYETGKPDVVRLQRTFERNGIEMATLRTCLEYGCGLGRVTRWLAPHFDQLYAYDISLPHLESIQDYLRQRQVNNVVVKQVQSVNDLAALPPVDLVYSLVVLQHNPPPVIALLLEQLLQTLNPGGYAYFQVPTYRLNYRFCLEEYLQNEGQRQEMEMHLLPQSTIFQIVQRTGAQLVEVLEDGHTGLRPKERSNSFLVRKLPKP